MTGQEYVPTTEQMMFAYTSARFEFDSDKPTMEQAEAEFRAGLEAHDREVKAQALREAAGSLHCQHRGPCNITWNDACTIPLNYHMTRGWLRDRADRIEAGDE